MSIRRTFSLTTDATSYDRAFNSMVSGNSEAIARTIAAESWIEPAPPYYLCHPLCDCLSCEDARWHGAHIVLAVAR